jgi:hypothetical protein
VRLGRKAILVLVSVCAGFACNVPSTHLQATHRGLGDSGTEDTVGPDTMGPDAAGPDTMDSRPASVDVRRDAGCLQSDFDLTTPKADVMLVVERSGVMNTLSTPGCSSCGTYWTTLVDALNALTSTTSGNFRWGLKLFPSPGDVDACFVSESPDVPLTSDANAIAQALASVFPKGGAPSALAIRQAFGYLDGVQSDGIQIIVLAMGGTPTCMAGDPSQDDSAATLAEVPGWPMPLYVVGPGPDQTALNNIGYTGSGIPRFRTDAVQYLGKAIRGAALGWSTNCTFALPGPLASGQTPTVLLDGIPVPQGFGGYGYSQDGSQVVLQGSNCINLGYHTSLTIKVGCGG